MKLNALVLHHIVAILVLIIAFGCGDSPKYSEEDVYRENNLLYSKDTRKPLTGKVIKKGKSGRLKSKWEYKNGLVDGTTENYFESGKLQAKGKYKNGKKEGKHTFYHPNGKIYELSNYTDGMLDGDHIVNLQTGKPKTKAKYKNGRLEVETNYSYSKDGILRKESTYIHGELKSKRLYHKNGKIKEELMNDSENKKQIKKEYSFLGALNKEILIADNKLDVIIYYTFDGKLSHESFCTESDSILRKDYSPTGKLISEELVVPKKSFYSHIGLSCNKPVTLR